MSSGLPFETNQVGNVFQVVEVNPYGLTNFILLDTRTKGKGLWDHLPNTFGDHLTTLALSGAKGESQVERQATRSNTNDPSYSHQLVSRDNDNGSRALFPYTKLPAMKLEVEVVAIG
ncbi:hypothetical protein NPIL_302111 [Nephila pilipes]|uniref:Uncharacterized protein n=1 Tax=Nephila pilipes TaxID=299642 RepID=A0A8X6IIC0_NEPPI|nr:hypothetical protein NPIL_302111 [Nephila pilipes]